MVNLVDPTSTITRLYESGKFAEMAEYCNKLLKSNPTDLLALQNITLAYIHLELFDKAIYYSEEVLKNNPNDTYALKNKIYSLENLGHHEEIILLASRLLENNPNDIWTLISLGLAYHELGKLEEAIKYYDKVLQLESNNLTAIINKALALSMLERHLESISLYDMAQSIEPSSEIIRAKSDAFVKLGMNDEAFLSAQGLTLEEIEQMKIKAAKNKCSIFHQFCLTEYEQIKDKTF